MKQDDYPEHIQELLIFKHRNPPGPKGDEYAAELENDTLPKELEQVKKLPKSCEDCDQVVVDRLLHIKKYNTPYSHWKQYCTNCNKYKHPVTGEYCLNQYEIATHHKEIAVLINKQRKTKKDK